MATENLPIQWRRRVALNIHLIMNVCERVVGGRTTNNLAGADKVRGDEEVAVAQENKLKVFAN